MSQPCNPTHTTGTWHREGKWLFMECYCGSRKQEIDIDTPAAYAVFEVESRTTIDGEEIE